ncbi:MAG: transcription termination factor NusG, partial [Hungatella sp.]
GKEQELVDMIHKMVPHTIYTKCFVMRRQLLKRLGGAWVEVTETLFPSYVFLDTQIPDQLFYELKRIPEYAKLLGNGQGMFIPLETGEEEFLTRLNQKDSTDMVEISTLVLNNEGIVLKIKGPLRYFEKEIVDLNLRKRFAEIEIKIIGEKKKIRFGIRLEKD